MKEAKIDILVSMLQKDEAEELGLTNEEMACANAGIKCKNGDASCKWISGLGTSARQSAVQEVLDNIKSVDLKRYNRVIGEIDKSLNGLVTKGLQELAPSDRAYAAILRGVSSDLGRDIKFENQSDREAIGNALIKDVRDKQN